MRWRSWLRPNPLAKRHSPTSLPEILAVLVILSHAKHLDEGGVRQGLTYYILYIQ